MSTPICIFICLIAMLMIIALLIVAIIRISKKNSGSKTTLTIEIPRLFKVHFEQENSKKGS